VQGLAGAADIREGTHMLNPPKPHVSAALAQLRHGVTICAMIVGLCAVVQMLVFGFVHFTQVRWAPARHEVSALSFTVVAPGKRVEAQPQGQPEAAAQAANQAIPRQHSDWEPTLNTASDLAVSIGVIATIMLAVQCALGVFIAGASAVPGVDKAVSAASWALLLALGGVPWHDFMPSIPFPGVFGDYLAMVNTSEALDAGVGSPVKLYAVYMLAPFASLAGSIMVLSRFRAGVARGIIITSVSEIDERLEREMAGIRARGVVASAPRAVVALNAAIGDVPEAPTGVLIPQGEIEESQPQGRKPGLFAPRNGKKFRRIGELDAGDGLTRPI
jgi:hypothetical protein